MPRLFRRRDKQKQPTGPWLAWWYTAEGKREQRSTHCYDKRAAEERYRQWEREAAKPARERDTGHSLEAALDLLLNQRAEEADAGKGSLETVKFYGQKADALKHVLGARTLLKDLTPGAIDDYISARRKAPVKDHTIHKELVTLRAALKLAKRRGWWRGDLAELIPPGFGQGYTPRTRALAPAELPRLLAELQSDNAARVAFIVATSARWSETTPARREDVAPSLEYVRLRGTKTGAAARVVPILAAGAPLLRYVQAHAEGAGGLLFAPWPNNVHRDLKAACDRAGLTHVTPNDLRRTFGKWLRRSGARTEDIAPAMGHVDDVMLQRVYGVLEPDELRAQLEASLHNTTNRSNSAAKPGESMTPNPEKTENPLPMPVKKRKRNT